MIDVYNDILDNDVVDNFVNFITSNDFKWYFNKDWSSQSENDFANLSKNVITTNQFVHIFTHNGEIRSDCFEMIKPIIKSTLKGLNIKHCRVNRVKLNMMLNDNEITENKYNVPHVDNYNTAEDSKTIIIYLSDSDGDTFFFNEKYIDKDVNTFTVLKRVTPKKGKMIVFDNNLYHASQNPIKSKTRLVINININSINYSN